MAGGKETVSMLPEKPAETTFPVHDLIRRRWSPRAFADRPVEPEKFGSLLEAARWAASSNNEQPWRFILATRERPEDFARLLGCLKESNQVWARQAPALMLSVARLTFADDGEPNRHALYDVGQAVASMAIQATALGLVIHQMAGFFPDKARAEFGIPGDFEPVTAIAIGYQGDPATLPERQRLRELAPREREPLSRLVFAGRWGEPAAVATGAVPMVR